MLRQAKRTESLAVVAKAEAEMLYQRARTALTDTVAAQRAAERQASNAIASLNCTEEMRIDAERRVVLAQEARDKMEYEKELAEKRESELRLALDQCEAEVAHLKGMCDTYANAKSQAESSLHAVMGSAGDQRDDFESKWSEAIQEKHEVLQDKIRVEAKLSETESVLAATSTKLSTAQSRLAELEAELQSTKTALDETATKLKALEEPDITAESVLLASKCVLSKHHQVLANAFEELQTENRQLRHELSASVAALADAQEARREVEDARARLEHEVHRISRLRGEAEMARSDAERQYRDLRVTIAANKADGLGSLSSGSPRRHKRSQSLRKGRATMLARRLSGPLLGSDDSSSESESRRTENSKLYWNRENWAVRSLKQAQGVIEVSYRRFAAVFGYIHHTFTAFSCFWLLQQSAALSIKDLENAAIAERHVVNRAKLKNRASTFTMRAHPSDHESGTPVATGTGASPRRSTEHRHRSKSRDDMSPTAYAHSVGGDDESVIASEALSALVRKLEETERGIDSLHSVRDKLEIEREQLEAMLVQERSLREVSDAKRVEMEGKLAELREVSGKIVCDLMIL